MQQCALLLQTWAYTSKLKAFEQKRLTTKTMRHRAAVAVAAAAAAAAAAAGPVWPIDLR
jgi:hypothetical protein